MEDEKWSVPGTSLGILSTEWVLVRKDDEQRDTKGHPPRGSPFVVGETVTVPSPRRERLESDLSFVSDSRNEY